MESRCHLASMYISPPLYIVAQPPLPSIPNNTPRVITNLLWMERYKQNSYLSFRVYNARQQTSDDVPCWCLEFNPPRWGQLPISKAAHQPAHVQTRRLLTAISSFESNEDEGIASCVPSKHPWTLNSATKRDFPRGKKTAISGWLSGRFQSFDLYWLIFAAASPHLV